MAVKKFLRNEGQAPALDKSIKLAVSDDTRTHRDSLASAPDRPHLMYPLSPFILDGRTRFLRGRRGDDFFFESARRFFFLPSNRLKTFSSSPSHLSSSDVYPAGRDHEVQGRGEREMPPTGDTGSSMGRVLAFAKTRLLCGCHQVSFHRHEICYLRGWVPDLNGILNLYQRDGGSNGARPAPGSSTEEPSSYEEVNPLLPSSVVFFFFLRALIC